ncbi:MAG: NADH-quinone oxidoreductase subunit NuoH [Acidobacteriota bacterium]
MNLDWLTAHVGMPLVKILILLVPVFTVVAYIVWFERRVLAFFQSRLGPNRVGPLGLLQPVADGLKLLLKEDIVPANARPFLFKMAPVFSFFPALVGFAVVSWALPWVTPSGKTHGFVIGDVNLGILLILSLSSLGIFGIILGGWSSGSKYPLFGSLRSASQMLAYEVPLTLSVISVILLAGSFRLSDIVAAQQSLGWYFLFPGLVAFGVYIVAAVAETNRTPFDLPEGESEIIGFHTEYSGMRFAFYFVAEYANVVLTSVVATALFLGGYDIPFVKDAALYATHPRLVSALGVCSFAAKGALFAYFFVWIRATWPRYRYDQLLRIGWLVLFPIAMANLVLVALFKLWLLR